MKESLKISISSLIKLSDLERDYLLSFFYPQVLKNNDYLLKVGDRCNKIFFVKSGMLRKSTINDKGEEVICCFLIPNQFVTSFSSFLSQNPTNDNIQSISETEVFFISKQDLDRINNLIPSTQEFGRKVAENLAILMENRMSDLIDNSSEERYLFILKNNLDLLISISNQQLASYLGVTPQHLSRIKKKYSL